MDDFNQKFGDMMRACDGSSAVSMDRNRPYDAQPWTCGGTRGQKLVEGLTMRDIGDCFTRAIVHSLDPDLESTQDLHRKLENGSLIWDSLYDAEGLSEISPGAVRQNLGCEIERMMGIYPNIDASLRGEAANDATE